MADGSVVKDYTALFDADVYLQTFYSSLSSQEDIQHFLFRSIHSSFMNGDLHGDRLLDIGTGPSVCSVISAAPRFKEIYLSDFSENNRSFLRKWLDGEASHSFQPFYEYFLKLEGKQLHWSVRETELKSKIKGILPCDVLQSSIFETDVGQFDVITSSLCLEAAANDIACYREICKRIASLVKKDGYIILVGVLEQTFYIACGHRFFSLHITKEDLIQSWSDAGFSIVNFQDQMAPPGKDNPFSDYGAGFVLVAKKSSI